MRRQPATLHHRRKPLGTELAQIAGPVLHRNLGQHLAAQVSHPATEEMEENVTEKHVPKKRRKHESHDGHRKLA